MSTRSTAAIALTTPAPARPQTQEGHSRWHALRQRWVCMGPDCAERNGLRTWCKLPARMQLQDGWCCSPECFASALELQARPLLRQAVVHPPHAHRIPLGLLLLSRGQITREQLRAALEAQQSHGGRIGEWLVRQGAVGEGDIAAGVALQWARPIFPLAQSQAWQQCHGWVPPAILESLRMLPLHFTPARRRLYVGFTQVVDSSALAALGRILDCDTEACIVADTAFDTAMERLRADNDAAAGQEYIHLEDMEDAAEVAGVARQYARFADARQVRLAAVGRYLWVRIRGQRVIHLTFCTRAGRASSEAALLSARAS